MMRQSNIKLILFTLAVILISACEYDDYQMDYIYSAIYFPKARINRTIIVGEYDYIQIGVVLGGKTTNDREEWVTYHMANDVLAGMGLTTLPPQYYTITNSLEGRDVNTFYIPSGKFMGMIKVTLNDLFLNDSMALTGNYALGFGLAHNTSVDSILPALDTTIITFKYRSSAEASYNHSGIASATDTVITYLHNVWDLSTVGVGEDALESNGLGNLTGSKYKFRLEIKDDLKVVLESVEGGMGITDSGESRYDPESRTFYLKYLYENKGTQFTSVDTLIFRNRIVDGINQWDL